MHDGEGEDRLTKANKIFDKFLLVCAYLIMIIFISIVLFILIININIAAFGLISLLKSIGFVGCLIAIVTIIHWAINKIIDSK